MKLLSSLILAIVAFLFLTGDADGQRKASVSKIDFVYDDVALIIVPLKSEKSLFRVEAHH